jgi:hypothetical protein
MSSIDPAASTPNTTFAEAIAATPTADATPGNFKIGLSSSGVQIGWLGRNDGGWAILVSDESEATTLELYPYNNVTYYRILGTKEYMSVSNNAYVGFYNWSGARGWTRDGSKLVSDLNGQKLSLYSKDNGYLYAWDKYTVLDITVSPVG